MKDLVKLKKMFCLKSTHFSSCLSKKQQTLAKSIYSLLQLNVEIIENYKDICSTHNSRSVYLLKRSSSVLHKCGYQRISIIYRKRRTLVAKKPLNDFFSEICLFCTLKRVTALLRLEVAIFTALVIS